MLSARSLMFAMSTLFLTSVLYTADASAWWGNKNRSSDSSHNYTVERNEDLSTRDYTRTRSPYPVGAEPIYKDSGAVNNRSSELETANPNYNRSQVSNSNTRSTAERNYDATGNASGYTNNPAGAAGMYNPSPAR